jgi:hypothetical protein
VAVAGGWTQVPEACAVGTQECGDCRGGPADRAPELWPQPWLARTPLSTENEVASDLELMKSPEVQPVASHIASALRTRRRRD